MNNVAQRTLTGGVYILLIILSLTTHPYVFALVAFLLNLAGTRELHRMLEAFVGKAGKTWIPLNSVAFAGCVILLVTGYESIWLAPCILLIILQFILPLFQESSKSTGNLLIPLFSTVYLSIPLLLLNQIHQVSIEAETPYLLAVFVIIWTNDTFAYLSGMAFGKHKLFERISPKKTWEGFAGGLLSGAIAAYIFFHFYPSGGLYFWMILAILVSVSAVFGEFIESLLKRRSGVKDSGNLLPGHGGILDRIDSLLLVSPVVYLFLVLTANLW